MTFRLTGAALCAVLETTIEFGGAYFPQVSGIRLDYDPGLPKWITCDTVRVGGPKLLDDKLYSVTVTEGVYGALVSPKVPMQDVTTLPDSAFTAARDFVQMRRELDAGSSSRIRDVAAIGDGGK